MIEDLQSGMGTLPDSILGSPGAQQNLKINAQAQDCFLKNAAFQKEKNDVAMKEAINMQNFFPIARYIAESLLKGTDFGIIKAEVEKKFPDKSQIKAAIDFLNRNANPELLVTNLTVAPALYDSCEKCGQFLHNNGIKVATVCPIKKCATCFHRKNATGSCSLIGAPIMKDGVSNADVNQAIDELHVKGRLSSSQVRELKMKTDARERLNEAVRLSYETKNKAEKSALTISFQNFATKENAILWVIDALSRAAAITQIKKLLRMKRHNADEIVNNAMAAVKTINADSLDCVEEKYRFPSSPLLVRSEKCGGCNHANDERLCRRHGLVFAQEYSVNNGETPEAKEILNFYAGSEMIADVDQSPVRPGVDVQFWNPGWKMVVDVGSGDSSRAPDNYQEIFEYVEPIVEVDPVKASVLPLEIDGLGSGEGFDISGLL
jgi:hypothetical protein